MSKARLAALVLKELADSTLEDFQTTALSNPYIFALGALIYNNGREVMFKLSAVLIATSMLLGADMVEAAA